MRTNVVGFLVKVLSNRGILHKIRGPFQKDKIERDLLFYMVPKRGLEPRRPKALPPQDSVSTNSTTSAFRKNQSDVFSSAGAGEIEFADEASSTGVPNNEDDPPPIGEGTTGGNSPS